MKPYCKVLPYNMNNILYTGIKRKKSKLLTASVYHLKILKM